MPATDRIQAKARTQFDIGLTELDIIEEALRYQAHSISMKSIEGGDTEEALKAENFRARMAEIQTVLGKLHNQKAWYVPKKPVPLG